MSENAEKDPVKPAQTPAASNGIDNDTLAQLKNMVQSLVEENKKILDNAQKQREADLKAQEELRARLDELSSSTVKLPKPDPKPVDPVEELRLQLEEQKEAYRKLEKRIASKPETSIEDSIEKFRLELKQKELSEYRNAKAKDLQFPDRLNGASVEEIDANLEKLKAEEKEFRDRLEADIKKTLPTINPLGTNRLATQVARERMVDIAAQYRGMTREQLAELQKQRLQSKLGKT